MFLKDKGIAPEQNDLPSLKEKKKEQKGTSTGMAWGKGRRQDEDFCELEARSLLMHTWMIDTYLGRLPAHDADSIQRQSVHIVARITVCDCHCLK